MALTKILRNTSGLTKQILNRDISNNESFDVPFSLWMKLADDMNIPTMISSGDIVVNNGSLDLSISDALSHIKKFQPDIPVSNSGFIFDTLDFSDNGSVGDAFINCAASGHSCLYSTYIALKNGEITAIAVSNQEDDNSFRIKVVKNAFSHLSGELKGGSQIGASLIKPEDQRDALFDGLSGYSFSQGDRIQCYIDDDGLDDAKKPLVRFYLRYIEG